MRSHENIVSLLKERANEHAPLIQVLLGPRQVGKTTALQKLMSTYRRPKLYVTADNILGSSNLWIQEQWNEALSISEDCLLIIDEIQKIQNWSEIVKRLWDNQKNKKKSKIKLFLSGSSSLHIQRGLTESLTGRFELIRAYHWGFEETHESFDMSMSFYKEFGGYPGSYAFIKNKSRWENFVKNSIIETVISKDILLHNTVKSPALFRQAFELLCCYPAQEVSYNKLLGQLQDKGNIDLIKYYIELFEGAFLFKAIHKYSGSQIMRKSSSPKVIPLAPALVSQKIRENKSEQGRVFEAMVGADLLKSDFDLFYWRDGKYEVDFCFEFKNKLIAIEVKSGRARSVKAMEIFLKKYPEAVMVFVTEANYTQFEKDPRKFIEKFLT